MSSAYTTVSLSPAWQLANHPAPMADTECAEALARYLAWAMNWDLKQALDRDARSYQAELGERRCSLEQAEELRRLTVKCCTREDEGAEMVLAESYADDAGGPRAVEKKEALCGN